MKTLTPLLFSIALLATNEAMASEQVTNQAGASPWGSSDEIGTLNYMTGDTRLDILQQVSSGRVYDLGVDLFVGMPDCCSDAFGDPTFQNWMIHVPSRGEGGELLSHSGDAIAMSTHTGTHIDALSHFGLNGEIWNGFKAQENLGARGWTKSGAEKFPPIVARGVLIDIAAAKGVDYLPASYTITVADLEEALKKQGTSLVPGDVVLIRTGLMTLWPDKTKLQLFNQPGLGLEAAAWLVEQGAMILGADNFGLESFPSKNPDNFAPVHSFLLAEKGVAFMEVLWLEDLAKDKVYQFLFVASPLKISGASGSPIRPLAIPIARNE